MHNYTFEITRETDSDHVYFPFHFRATVNLPAEAVWEEWIRTITGKQGSWLWPRQYTQPSVKPMPPKAGGILVNAYQIPNPHDPSKPDKVTAYEFHIEVCDSDSMQFTYRATDEHPFLKGGGTLQIKALDGDTSLLEWRGKYRHTNDHGKDEEQGDVFAFFICSFFTALAQNIKKAVGFDKPQRASA